MLSFSSPREMKSKLKEGSTGQGTSFPTLVLQATLGLAELRVDTLIRLHEAVLFKHYLR